MWGTSSLVFPAPPRELVWTPDHVDQVDQERTTPCALTQGVTESKIRLLLPGPAGPHTSPNPLTHSSRAHWVQISHSCDFRCITVKHFEYSDEAIIAEHLKQQLCPLDSDDAIASHQIKTVVLSLCVKLSTTRCQSRGWSPYQTYRWRQSIRQQCLPTGVKEMTVTGSQFFAFTRQLLKALGGVSLLWFPHISK